ncbi:MAG: type II toxin-antitoxin system prevent-host-death family antitoxin [Burkholderiaceae bacterium]
MSAAFSDQVSATRLVRDLAAIRSRAIQAPVTITSHGRAELVLVSAERFARLSEGNHDADRANLEAKLETVLDCIETHVVFIDHELRVRRINRAMRRSLRLPDGPLRGRPIGELLPPGVAPFMVKRFEEVMRSGLISEFDLPSLLRPGRLLHARLIPWPGGVAYFSDDVTDRMNAIDRDMEASALQEALQALGGRGVGSVNGEGVVASANPGLAAMTGAGPGKLMNSRLTALFDPADRGRIDASLHSESAAVLDVHYLLAGIEVRAARLSLAPYLTSDARKMMAFVLENR